MNNEIIPRFDDVKVENLTLILKKTDHKNLIIVSVSGYIDSYNSTAFQKAMSLVTQKYNNIIFNMANCGFVASTGIGSFTHIYKIVKPQGGAVYFAHMPPRIYEVFQLLGFTSFFPFEETVQDAIKNFEDKDKPVEIFPFMFKCPICEKKLRAVKAGRFRCKECKTIISIDGFGNIRMT